MGKEREKRKGCFHCVWSFDPWFPLGVIVGSSSESGKIAGVHVFAPFS